MHTHVPVHCFSIEPMYIHRSRVTQDLHECCLSLPTGTHECGTAWRTTGPIGQPGGHTVQRDGLAAGVAMGVGVGAVAWVSGGRVATVSCGGTDKARVTSPANQSVNDGAVPREGGVGCVGP